MSEQVSAEINALRECGRNHFNEGRYSEAVENFSKVIEMMQNSEIVSNIFYYRATAFGCMKEWTKAINDYSKVIELDAKFVDAYLYRGMTLFKINDFGKAEDDFTKFIEMSGTYTSFLYRGFSRINIRKETEAIEDLNQFLEKEPNHTQALFHRGISHRILDNLSQAISDLTRVIELTDEWIG